MSIGDIVRANLVRHRAVVPAELGTPTYRLPTNSADHRPDIRTIATSTHRANRGPRFSVQTSGREMPFAISQRTVR